MSLLTRRIQRSTNYPRGVWPSTTNVGLQVATTQTLPGANIDDATWFTNNGFSVGTGTHSDPYLVDRVLFTDIVFLGQWDPNPLEGKWVKFTNCRFYGNPANPTDGGSSCLATRPYSPYFIVEDSTLGPSGGTIPSGGPPSNPGGTETCIHSYTPFEARRCDMFGANVMIGIETEQGDSTTIIESNYLHDTWSAAGDHTDIINGNQHASHVMVRHNYMDGHRTGDTYVTNGIGIYDQPPGDPAGIIRDWTIDNNYIDRAATMILSNGSTSRVLDPFIVTNNIFTNNFTVLRYNARTPSFQSNNMDQSDNQIAL